MDWIADHLPGFLLGLTIPTITFLVWIGGLIGVIKETSKKVKEHDDEINELKENYGYVRGRLDTLVSQNEKIIDLIQK